MNTAEIRFASTVVLQNLDLTQTLKAIRDGLLEFEPLDQGPLFNLSMAAATAAALGDIKVLTRISEDLIPFVQDIREEYDKDPGAYCYEFGRDLARLEGVLTVAMVLPTAAGTFVEPK